MTMLYLCEKPSQAKDIARVLGANQRRDGYFEGQQVVVTIANDLSVKNKLKGNL